MQKTSKIESRLKDSKLEVIELLEENHSRKIYLASMIQDGRRQLVTLRSFNCESLQENGIDVQVICQRNLAVARLRHPNLVRVFTVDADDEFVTVIEDHLEGGTLAAQISRRSAAPRGEGPLFSPLEIVRLAIQLCDGLALFHKEKHYHGSISPQIVRFRNASLEEGVLTDFGYEDALDRKAMEWEELRAILYFISPEQTGFVKAARSASMDIYSIGALMYAMAVGRAPFDGDNPQELINRILSEAPAPLSRKFANFPLPLCEIISKLLRKSPNERYHSVLGLASDLRRCFDELSKGRILHKFALASKDRYRELNYQIPLLGRDQEVRRLQQLYEQSRRGVSSFALIGALSGGGKSRLAIEVSKQATLNRSFVGHAKFSEYERNLPLSALTQLLREHALYLRSKGSSELSQWQDQVRERLGSKTQILAQRFQFYANLLPQSERSNAAEFSQQFNQTFAEFLCLLSAGSESQLIIIDDLQWADFQSLQILGALANLIRMKQCAKTLIIGTYRTEEVPSEHPIHKLLFQECLDENFFRLSPLSKHGSDRIVECLLEEEGPEVEKLQAITYRFTEGNPFHIQEFIKHSVKDELFRFDEERKVWILSEDKVNSSKLSAGMRELVMDRLRSLSPISRELLSIASISGSSIKRKALATLLPQLLAHRNRENLLSHVEDIEQTIELAYDDLLQKNLIVPSADSIRFFHDKIEETAHELLISEEMRLLHHWLGIWYIEHCRSTSQMSNDEDVFKGAHHLAQGDSWRLDQSARSFLILAAQKAHDIFAYDKEREYLGAAVESIEHETDEMTPEKFDVLMSMANALVISEKISDAMFLYDKLLESDSTPMQKARIHSKKCEFALNLFDYEQARRASAAGLKCLGLRIITTDFAALLFILIFSPLCMIYALFFKYVGKQTRIEKREYEKVCFELLLKNQISQYFTSPIAAIANQIRLNFILMKYKDSNTRTTLLLYWGVVAAAFGMYKWSDKCFSRAYDYFDQSGNPLDKGFAVMVWGLQSDMVAGNLAGAQKKLEEAVRILAPLGESFWRAVALSSLILLDYFGGETGDGDATTKDYIDLMTKVRFAGTGSGCLVRYFMQAGDSTQVEHLMKLTTEAEEKLRAGGFQSIDCIYSLIGRGEYFEARLDFEKASELFKRATRMTLLKAHRGPYPNYAPLAYARSLTRQKKLLQAVVPLGLSWINLLLNVQLFRPQTYYVTGSWLYAFGWKSMGQRLIEQGIEAANKREWESIVAEGRLTLGRILIDDKPSMAFSLLRLSKDYYSKKNWRLQLDDCDYHLSLPNLANIERRLSTLNSKTSVEAITEPGGIIRSHVEIKSMLGVLLKLSALSDKDSLFQAMMESLCHATGSEFAILYMQEGGAWHPRAGYRVDLSSEAVLSPLVATAFVSRVLTDLPSIPVVLDRGVKGETETTSSRSAMMIPILYENKKFGYCYLANNQLAHLYDQKSIEIAVPIASQSAIAFQNIVLNSQLSIERDTLADLHRTLEQRVIDHTRDIKGIMLHIQMGICTISGNDLIINRDYSQCLEKILGRDNLAGKPLLPILFNLCKLSEDEQSQALNGLRFSIGQPDFAFYANEHVLPRNLRGETPEGKPVVLELDWIPISNDNAHTEKVLLTINDVTQLRGLEELASQKDLELRVMVEILGCSDQEWRRFMKSCHDLSEQNTLYLRKLEDPQSRDDVDLLLRAIFINLHTIKGNARSVGCKYMNEVIHSVEEHFAKLLRNHSQPDDLYSLGAKIDAVEKVVMKYQTIAKEKLGRNLNSSRTLDLDKETLLKLYQLVEVHNSEMRQDQRTLGALFKAIRDAAFRSAKDLFDDIFSSVRGLSLELNKANPIIAMDFPPFWVTEKGEEILRNSLLHLIRNSMDHGIEFPNERLTLGKPPQGKLTLQASITGEAVEIRFRDDGRGLNMKKLTLIGKKRGLLVDPETQDDSIIASLIFAADVSTTENVSEVSGRGMGMAAVLKYIQAANGSIAIEFMNDRPVSKEFRAIQFVISLPHEFFHFEQEALRHAV